MMDYDSVYRGMMNGNTGATSIFMWLIYVLVVALLVLGIVALAKYIQKQ